METIANIISYMPAYVKRSVSDITSGVLQVGEKKVASIRLTLDRVLTREECEYLAQIKSVIKVSTCQYRYAPEIKHSVIYIKN